MLGLLHLLNRLPTRTLKISDLADSLHRLLYGEEKQSRGDNESIRDFAEQKLQS